MSTLKDADLVVEVIQKPRTLVCHVDTVSGRCFDDGTHGRVLEVHNGTKRELLKQMADFIASDTTIACDDPECDICCSVETPLCGCECNDSQCQYCYPFHLQNCETPMLDFHTYASILNDLFLDRTISEHTAYRYWLQAVDLFEAARLIAGGEVA